MKNVASLLFSALLFLNSCSEGAKDVVLKADQTTGGPDSSETIDSSMLVLERYFTIEKISKSEYEKIPDPFALPPCDVADVEAYYAKQFNAKIRRSDSTTLKIECLGRFFELKDIRFEDSEENMVHHRFHGTAGELVIVMEYYYESYAFHFYDLSSCDHHSCIGYPVLSPDARRILAYNADLTAQFTPNGLQYFSLEGNKWILKWELEINDWEPHGLKWENTSALVLIVRKPDFGAGNPQADQYYRLRFKD